MSNDFYFLKNDVIKEILSKDAESIKQIIKKAYLAHELGRTIVPGSHFLNFSDGIPASRIIALPAYIADEFNIAGIKWVSSNPKNLAKNLPRASGVIILNDPNTGRPFACLEGSLISSTRTAASAVLAAEYMHTKDKNLDNLGLIGTGPIAQEIYHYFMQTGWKIKDLTLYDIKLEKSESFQSKIKSNLHDTINIASSVEELVKNCDGIVLATTSTTPYLHDVALFQHHPLILNISLRDLGPEILFSSHNVVDDVTHVLSANTSPHMAQQHYGHTNFIDGTLGGLIQGKFQLTNNKPVIFSPMGLGILDLVVSKYIFDKAAANNHLTAINNFFGQ